MKPTLYVMCGLQGSGKSTYAKRTKFPTVVTVVSSDEIRKEFPDAKNDTVFQILYKRVNELLAQDKSVVLDATNITIKSRRQIFQNVKVPCTKTCIIMNTSYGICVERVKARNAKGDDHYVPLEVLERYYKSFEVPFYEEGWDSIEIEHMDYGSFKELKSDIMSSAMGFNQHNKHHTQDLGTHMLLTGAYLMFYHRGSFLRDDAVYVASTIHDCGKLFTQTFDADGQAHYYNHANVGAYHLLCGIPMDVADDYFLDVVFFVNYHMHMYNLKSEKSIEKWKRIFGERKFGLLEKLHEADMNSHTM